MTRNEEEGIEYTLYSASISFEDTTGIYEAVLLPKVYHRYCHMLNGSRPYILEGKVEEDFGALCVTVDRIGFLDRYGKKGIKRSSTDPFYPGTGRFIKGIPEKLGQADSEDLSC